MNILNKIINKILNIIYPQKCIFCQEVIPIIEDDFICKDCHMDIDYITFDKVPFISIFQYNEKTRFSIHRLKYYNRPDYAKYFAKMMYLKFCKFESNDFDLISYVPMHSKKKKKRGYDQAELLAMEFSKLTNIKIAKDNLIRSRNTLPQSKVSFEERKTNIKDAFYVKEPFEFKDKNVILIDDIYTSGSTISQCAQEIKKAGANSICFLVLAKALKDNS